MSSRTAFPSVCRLRVTLVIASAALLSTCTYPYAVWVLQGSTATHLSFGLATKRGGRSVKELRSFYVEPCHTRGDRQFEERMWHISFVYRAGKEGIKVHELIYGQPPSGYEEQIPARALIPGCYKARADAAGGRGGGTAFWALTDGSIAEFTERQLDSAYAASEQRSLLADSLAQLRCYQGYRNAKTANDSSVVDHQVWYDTTYFPPALTCQEICTRRGPGLKGEEDRRTECSTPQRHPW